MKDKKKQETYLAAWLGDAKVNAPAIELTEALDALYASGPDENIALRVQANLAHALQEVLPVKAYYDLFSNTPVGKLWVAVSEGKLIGIEFDVSERDFVSSVEKRNNAVLIRSGEKVAASGKQVLDYLQGKIKKVDLPIDIERLTNFHKKVLQAALSVPRGQVATYAEIAEQIGKPKAFRAVGQALRNNPIPIVIPCHRVIASDGTLGGYQGRFGNKRKVMLLKLEGVMLA